MFCLLVVLFSFGFCAPPGTLLQFDPNFPLAAINIERGSWWGIPIIEWNSGLQTMAETNCVLCKSAITSTGQQRSDQLGKILGFKSTSARWASVGENRAFTDGANGNASPGPWLAAYASHNDTTADWTCLTNKCKSGVPLPACQTYTQVVWYRTQYMGCGLCSCPTGSPTGTNPWTLFVCNFNEAGNYGSEHPFEANAPAVCNRTFTIPFPQPQPVCKTCQDPINCPAPTATATCSTSGPQASWVINGDTPISSLGYINCSTTINGQLTGGASDELKVTYCGSLFVNGAVTFTAPPALEFDMLSKGGVAQPGAFQQFMTFISGSAQFQAPQLINVWTPSIDLSARVQSSLTSAYIYFFATSNQGPPPGTLPDGTAVASNSAPSETLPPEEAGAGGTLIDVNRPLFFGPTAPTRPGATPSTPSNGTSGKKGLPGWAIFLIVLACIIGVALLIGIIVLLISSSSKEERM